MYIIYGLDTKSIEDAEQCVLVKVPDDLDAETQAEWLEEHGDEGYEIQHLIGILKYLDICLI